MNDGGIHRLSAEKGWEVSPANTKLSRFLPVSPKDEAARKLSQTA